MRKYTIYGLADPRGGIVRYVGVTSRNPLVRLIELRSHKRRYAPGLKAWLANLHRAGIAPRLVLFAKVDDPWAGEREWIARMRAEGNALFNRSDGGRGAQGANRSMKVRRQVAAKIRGQKRSAATRRRISLAKLGKPRPDVGERNRNSARLTYAQAATIRERLACGERAAALAVDYGVSTALISLVKQGKRRVPPRT